NTVKQFLNILIARQTFYRFIFVQALQNSGMLGNMHCGIEGIVIVCYCLKALDHHRKVSHRPCTTAIQKLTGMAYHVPQAILMLICSYDDAFDGRVANPPSWIIDDPLERFLVIRIEGQSKVRDQIFDLLALVE